MSTDYRRVSEFLRQIVGDRDQTDAKHLRPHFEPAPPAVPGGSGVDLDVIDERWSLLPNPPESRARVADPASLDERESYCRNVENFIGTVKLPVGVIGPIRINGLFARGDFYVPLATTEAALVASHSRGARLITEAGGCTVALLNEGVTRAPGFAFATLTEAGLFVMWAAAALEKFREVAEATTSHGKLTDMRVTVEGNHVYLAFEFTTGDASGQNMVTIATDAICQHILAESPVKPRAAYVEANLSGDKKATTQSFLLVRGKKVSAEVMVPAALVEKRLHTTPTALIDYWRMSALGGVMSGSIGVHGHYANGLAALYIACGQDPACVAESAIGVTRFELMEDGGLYAAVTLPNLMIGTVGGGTSLPSQSACLDILGLRGPGKARALAEVCAGLALAGELSITGALAAGHFTRAHQRLARGIKSREQAADEQGRDVDGSVRRGSHQAFMTKDGGSGNAPVARGANRWIVYQRERFPFAAHAPLVAAFSLSAVSFSALLRGENAGDADLLLPSWRGVLVAYVTSLLFFLQLRIADEHKDCDEDARYRPYRPVPRGLVTLRELTWIGIGSAIVQLALAVWLSPALIWLLLVTWIYFALMTREFFAREWLKARPVAYLFSHMLIMPLIDLYATACDWWPAGYRRPPDGLFWFLIVSFFNGLAIEIGRKVRAPGDEEHGVETYSKLWGPRGAIAAWMSAIAATAAAAFVAAALIGSEVIVGALLFVLLLACVFAAARFLRTPDTSTGKGIEVMAGIWTLGMYLSLGVLPLVLPFIRRMVAAP